MAERSLVLDANIFLRAIVGQRVGNLIWRYAAEVGFFAPDTVFLEVEEHLPRLCAKAGMPLELAMAAYERLGALVQELPGPAYEKYRVAAQARIARRDADDWPAIACALVLDCPVWTEDRDFFGTGIAVWTTDRVELYLATAEAPGAEQEKS
jgi:predicted nucleic acid-binding protein